MAKLTIEVEDVRKVFVAAGAASLRECNPSAFLTRIIESVDTYLESNTALSPIPPRDIAFVKRFQVDLMLLRQEMRKLEDEVYGTPREE